MRLVFLSQNISFLTDILQPTHWSMGSNSAMGTNRGGGGEFFLYLWTRERPATQPQCWFSLHLKFACMCKTQLSNFKFNNWNRGATHNWWGAQSRNVWTFVAILALPSTYITFINCSNKCHTAYEVFLTSCIIFYPVNSEWNSHKKDQLASQTKVPARMLMLTCNMRVL